MTNLQKHLEALSACAEARDWVGDRSLSEAWTKCPRADWMLWLAARCLPRPRLVGVAAEVAATVLHLTNDERVAHCLETCWAFERGEATLEDCHRAAYAAYAASYDVYFAASAAGYAAASASAATSYAADLASATAADASYAADAAYADAEDLADLVRRLVPVEALGLEGM